MNKLFFQIRYPLHGGSCDKPLITWFIILAHVIKARMNDHLNKFYMCMYTYILYSNQRYFFKYGLYVK